MANVGFLIAMLVFAADPMKASVAERSEGLGLSPLLQHPSMLIHPPVVFLAYAAWGVPFAVAFAALITGRLDRSWLDVVRPWGLFAWTVLGAGLLLGANWAYQELGWGGYWGWDPVENGSLLPWLTGTGLIHGLMTWRFRGGLKKSTLALAITTFGLCNFATFLTRSGIFSSVHAFSESPIGWMFLGLMLFLLVVGVGLLWHRRRELVAEHAITGLMTREALVLATNFLLVLFAAVVLIGTLCLPLSQWITGRMAQIGPAFYGNVLAPIALGVLTALGAAPLFQWGRPPGPKEMRVLGLCVLAGMLTAGACWAAGERQPLLLAVELLGGFVVASTVARIALDMTRRSTAAGWTRVWLVWRNRRLYAGFTVHLGLAALALGACGSALGTQRVEWDMREGEIRRWAGRTLEYRRLIQREEPERLIAETEIVIHEPGGRTATLLPARHYHALQGEWTSEVAIHSTWSGDLYVILHAGLGEGRVALTLIENPLMRWLWAGGWLTGLAGCAALFSPGRGRPPALSVGSGPQSRPTAGDRGMGTNSGGSGHAADTRRAA